jgi:hypothetical protein
MKGSWRQRCDARAKHTSAYKAGKIRGLNPCCRRWAVPGKTRCHLHGGHSTGPKTPEGKARSLAARLEGRRRRIAELALQGKKINGGHNGGRPRKDGQPMQRRTRTHQQILDALAALAPPDLTPHQQEIAAQITAEAEARKALAEQREISRLLRLVHRGTDNALSRNRDEALIAQALDALHALRQKWHGPK